MIYYGWTLEDKIEAYKNNLHFRVLSSRILICHCKLYARCTSILPPSAKPSPPAAPATYLLELVSGRHHHLLLLLLGSQSLLHLLLGGSSQLHTPLPALLQCVCV